MKKRIISISMLLMLTPAMAWADASLDANKVREVMNYYHSGNTVILVNYKLCSSIAKEGKDKNECTEVIEDANIEKGSKAYLWMNFLVPGDDIEKTNVLVQFKYKGKAMNTSEIPMPQSIRYRTWRTLPTKKPGDWQVSIEQENETGFTSIDSIAFTVVDSSEAIAGTQ